MKLKLIFCKKNNETYSGEATIKCHLSTLSQNEGRRAEQIVFSYGGL